MIISFWSTHHGQPGTTTNMISIGLCAALKFKMKVLLASAQSGQGNLKSMLIPHQQNDESMVGQGSAVDLMRIARNGLLQPQSLANYTTPLLKSSQLDVMADVSLEGVQKEELNVFGQVLNMAKDVYDLVLLDLHSGLNKDYIQTLLANSDGVVVNNNQKLQSLDALEGVLQNNHFQHSPLLCIGRYEKLSKMNVRLIKKITGFKQIITVDYNPKLIDVINEGAMLDYFGRYYYSKRQNSNISFFKQLTQSTTSMLKTLEMIK